MRLQSKAFADGAAGYRTAFTADRIGRTIAYTIGLALGSLAIALVLGTLLAWAATRLPPRLRILRVVPVLPIVVPAIASVVGWAFLLSPRPGYLNAALRTLPWWSDLEEGPIDIYTMPWIVIITGIGLTAFVYLFVAAGFESINSEHLEAAQVAGSSQLGVFFRVTLPLLRPTLLYGGGVALLLGLGQFTGPLLLGRTAGIDVVTTEIYADMSQTPVQYGSAAALGSTLLVFGVIVVAMQKVLLRDRKRFVTHGGKAFRSPGRPSKLAAVALVGYTFIATVLPGQRAHRRVAVELLERRHRRRRLHARQLPADLRAVQRHRRHLQQRHDLAASRWRSASPSASSPPRSSSAARGTARCAPPPTSSSPSPSGSRPCCSVPASS